MPLFTEDKAMNIVEDINMMVHYQNKLMRIIHAINCPIENVGSCTSRVCDQTRLEIMHAAGCAYPMCCTVPGCSEVTMLLAHWTTCREWGCVLCRQVWGPNKDAEYDLKRHYFEQIKTLSASILELASLSPDDTKEMLQKTIECTFEEIDFLDYENEVIIIKIKIKITA